VLFAENQRATPDARIIDWNGEVDLLLRYRLLAQGKSHTSVRTLNYTLCIYWQPDNLAKFGS
jgi:hypothetical protein